METKGKSLVNWENELWYSIDEQDVMQLRNKLNDIQFSTENRLQSYNMNSSENSDNKS